MQWMCFVLNFWKLGDVQAVHTIRLNTNNYLLFIRVQAKKMRENDIEETYDVVWKCYRGQSFGETALESAGTVRRYCAALYVPNRK